jgi:hypothetical protein
VDAEPNWVHNDQGERSASIVNIDNGKYIAVVAVCAALCGISAVMAYNATNEARNASTEYRVLLNHYMQLEASVKEMGNER